jgi:AraC-like DNA-binding protein
LAEPNDINRISPWAVDFRQIEPGPMETRVIQRSGDAITLLEISMSHAVHQTGVSPKGALSVGLIRPNNVETWQGKDLSSAELVYFGSSDPFDGVSKASFRGFTLSIDQTVVEEVAVKTDLDIPGTLWRSGSPQIVTRRASLDAVRRSSHRFLRDASVPMTHADEEDIILALLITASSNTSSAGKSGATNRARALKAAIDVMFEHQHENLPISTICERTGTSWRTLDRAFNETFGIGPKRYYLRLRLNRARSRIFDRLGSDRISDVANEFGFWHLGEFARDYRNMFGELPSETNTDCA